MTAPWEVIEAQENHEWLLGQFLELLLAQNPASVLDVGCGAGGLLKRCLARGVPATGIDRPGERLDALMAEGLDVREGSAYDLGVQEGSVDWILMRHIPHHLEDPARAFAEALRVAARGVLIAEPCFDESLPCQLSAVALDVWEKAQHRRRGMVHDEVLDLGALLAALPADFAATHRVQVHLHHRLRSRSVEAFAASARELLTDLPDAGAEERRLEQLLERLHRDGLSWNGSRCLLLTRIR